MIKEILSDRYIIREQLGSSLFNDTYLAVDRYLPGQPLCVVKHLKASIDEGFDWEKARRFFDAEARVLYRLSQYSSEIPRLLAHFEEQQEFYLVQEYVAGHDLSHELILGRSLPEAQVIKLIREILLVLKVVHAQGVIHRDIKPRNLMRRLQDRKIVLIDFGAVKQLGHRGIEQTQYEQTQHEQIKQEQAKQTTQTILIGTVGYMASEQRAGNPRFCSDIYSVGMVALQALTGLEAREFGEDAQGELCWRQMTRVSPRFAAILAKMVRTHWRDRYQSVEDLLTDLEKLQSSKSLLQMPLQVYQLFWRSRSLQATLALMMLILNVSMMRQIEPIQNWLTQNWLTQNWLTQNWLTQNWLTQTSVGSSGLSPFGGAELIPLRLLDSRSDSILALAMHPQGKVVVSGGQNKVIQFWEVQSGKLLTALTGHQQKISALDITPDGQTLVSGSADRTIKVWDLQRGVLRYTLIGHQDQINAVRISADGHLLFSGSADRTIKVWNLQTGQLLLTLEGHETQVNQLALSADGQLIMSAGADGSLWLWNWQTGALLRTWQGHQRSIEVLAISPDRRVVVSGAADKIMVWSMATGERVRTFPTASKATRSIAFSPDGNYLVSAHEDGTMKLWNWRQATLLDTKREHSDSVVAVMICPKERTLISGGSDRRLGIWQLHF